MRLAGALVMAAFWAALYVLVELSGAFIAAGLAYVLARMGFPVSPLGAFVFALVLKWWPQLKSAISRTLATSRTTRSPTPRTVAKSENHVLDE